MKTIFFSGTGRSKLGECIKSIWFDLLMCLICVASVVMVCLTNPVTNIQIVFVIMVSALTWLAFILDILSDHYCKKMLQIQETFTLCTFICVIMWMLPISVFWSYIPMYIGTIISHYILCDKEIELYNHFGETLGLGIAQTGLLVMLVCVNMQLF